MIPFTDSYTLDLTKLGDEKRWPVSNFAWAKVQAALGNAFSGWQSGVITWQITLDGSNWDDIGETGITFSANGIEGPFDLRDAMIRAIVTTVASGTAFVTVTLHGMQWSNA